MASPEYDVFVGDGDTVGPSRPDIDDLGGGLKENDPEYPPDPVRMPDARDFNQLGWAVAALCRLTGVAVVSVEYASNVPFISGVWSLRDDVTPASFTVTESVLGTVVLSWTEGTFPTGPQPSGLTNNDPSVEADHMRAERTDTAEITVKMKHSSTGVRAAFTVTIGGEGAA